MGRISTHFLAIHSGTCCCILCPSVSARVCTVAPGRAPTAKHCNVKSSILALSKERIHEFQKKGLFPILSAILLSLVTGCSADPAPRDSTGAYISNQWAGASLVVQWRRAAHELWQHADALEREAMILSRLDPEQNNDEVHNKLALARKLRAADDARAKQATQLQQLLPFRMIQ